MWPFIINLVFISGGGPANSSWFKYGRRILNFFEPLFWRNFNSKMKLKKKWKWPDFMEQFFYKDQNFLSLGIFVPNYNQKGCYGFFFIFYWKKSINIKIFHPKTEKSSSNLFMLWWFLSFWSFMDEKSFTQIFLAKIPRPRTFWPLW